jgi:peptidoglycan/xylan/chitin deacetylase (PgdA/CDA1 family)
MFHSVGLDTLPWAYPHIAEAPGHFERSIAALRSSGHSGVFFVDENGTDDKAVALTFDDGYLDNWVHVLPILTRYAFKATVFVTVEFVDPRPLIRAQVQPGAIADSDHHAEACCAGFLSWSELEAMEQSGLVDVQSHGLTHTWHFSGPRVVDFWRPGSATEADGPVWLLWNEFPELKPYYLTRAAEHEGRIPYGTPIYEHGKALETRRFFPGARIGEDLIAYVAAHGGKGFFEDPAWREVLQARVRRFHDPLSRPEPHGRFETDDEFEGRVRRELVESKETIEARLHKEVRALCWPGGGVNEHVLEIARQTGYTRFTLPSKWGHLRREGRLTDLLPRIGGSHRIRWRGRNVGQISAREFLWQVQAARGSRFHRLLTRASLAAHIGRSYLSLGSRPPR